MKICLVITLVVTVSSGGILPDFVENAFDSFVDWITPDPLVIHIAKVKHVTNVTTFEEFKKKADRKYWDSDDEAMHRGIFNVNNEFIKKHNERLARGEEGYSLDANFFADYRPSDLLLVFTGIRKSAEGDAMAKPYLIAGKPKLSSDVPSKVDWNREAAVTLVQYQGICRSGWAFAATGAVEGHRFAKDHRLISLSKQELVACSKPYQNEGCDGGFHDYAFAYIAAHGISREEDYPYVGFGNHACETHKNTQGKYFIEGFRKIPPGDEAELQRVVANLGPVACSLSEIPEDFVFYKFGIYNNPQCRGSTPRHSILVVGYGEDNNGKPLWVIKNSWSHGWAEYRYAQLPRNENFCGIAADCSYPVLKED